MKLLALDTSTDTLSVAVGCGTGAATQVWQRTSPGGALASTHLIGVVVELLDEASLKLQELDAIAFGAGPGSFTGLRTACAVAQGLGFGANLPLLPVDSLLAVAQHAHIQTRAHRVTALLDARMDELYVADYELKGTQWQTLRDACLIRPDGLLAWLVSAWGSQARSFPASPFTLDPASQASMPGGGIALLAGNVFSVYPEPLQQAMAQCAWVSALPTAAAMLQLAPALLAAGLAVPAAQASPRYVRDKVAKTTRERTDEKAAAALAVTGPAP